MCSAGCSHSTSGSDVVHRQKTHACGDNSGDLYSCGGRCSAAAAAEPELQWRSQNAATRGGFSSNSPAQQQQGLWRCHGRGLLLWLAVLLAWCLAPAAAQSVPIGAGTAPPATRSAVTAAVISSNPSFVTSSTFPVNTPYLHTGELPAGTYEPFFTCTWRFVGRNLDAGNTSLAVLLMSYIAPTFNASYGYSMTLESVRAGQSALVQSLPDPPSSDPAAANMTRFTSVDFIMLASWTRGSIWPDLGLATDTNHQRMIAALNANGYQMVSWITEDINLTASAIPIMARMPITPQSSWTASLALNGPDLFPFTIEKQDLVLTVLQSLLITEAKVAIMKTLSASEDAVLPDGSQNVSVSLMMTQDSNGADLGSILRLVTSNNLGPALFSSMMEAVGGLQASGSVLNITAMPGASVYDQAVGTLAARQQSSAGVSVGAIVGPVVAAIVVLVLAALIGGLLWRRRRLRRRNGQQKGGTKGQNPSGRASDLSSIDPLDSMKLEGGGYVYRMSSLGPGGGLSNAAMLTSQHDSVTTTHSRASSGRSRALHSNHAAWDIRPEDIEICTLPDGSPWLLGEGSFGQVFRGLRGSVQDVAVKMLTSTGDYHQLSFRKEIEIMKILSFDSNVCQFYGTCLKDDKVLLVLEYLEGGDLREAMSGERSHELRWGSKGWLVALDIVRGLHFLHTNRVIHMDLKSRNILLTRNFESAKIGDVGLAHIIGSSTLSDTAHGTFAYAAPELLLNQRCNEKADIYSLGVILHELVTEEPPIRGRLREIRAPEEAPEAIVRLIWDCLSTRSAERPSAKEVFQRIKDIMAQQPQQQGQAVSRCSSLIDEPLTSVLRVMDRHGQGSGLAGQGSASTAGTASSRLAAVEGEDVAGEGGVLHHSGAWGMPGDGRSAQLHDSALSRQQSMMLQSSPLGPALGSQASPQALRPLDAASLPIAAKPWVAEHVCASPFALESLRAIEEQPAAPQEAAEPACQGASAAQQPQQALEHDQQQQSALPQTSWPPAAPAAAPPPPPASTAPLHNPFADFA